jgi:hypothetical protein
VQTDVGEPGSLNIIINGMSHGASNMILGPKDKVQNGEHTIHQDQNIMHQNHADYILRFQRDNS